MVDTRKLEAKRREVRSCVPVVKALNERDVTDYFLDSSERYLEKISEDAIEDVVLQSASGRHPLYPIQVCEAPSRVELTDNNGNIKKIEGTLREALISRGVLHANVAISLPDRSIGHKSSLELIGQCADLIVQNCLPGPCALDWLDIDRFVPGLHKVIRRIYVMPARELTVRVALRSGWVPSDGRLIDESIRKKEGKYPTSLKAKTALVVKCSAFIDPEQVAAYIATRPVSGFKEAWIVVDGSAIPLKQAHPSHR